MQSYSPYLEINQGSAGSSPPLSPRSTSVLPQRFCHADTGASTSTPDPIARHQRALDAFDCWRNSHELTVELQQRFAYALEHISYYTPRALSTYARRLADLGDTHALIAFHQACEWWFDIKMGGPCMAAWSEDPVMGSPGKWITSGSPLSYGPYQEVLMDQISSTTPPQTPLIRQPIRRRNRALTTTLPARQSPYHHSSMKRGRSYVDLSAPLSPRSPPSVLLPVPSPSFDSYQRSEHAALPSFVPPCAKEADPPLCDDWMAALNEVSSAARTNPQPGADACPSLDSNSDHGPGCANGVVGWLDIGVRSSNRRLRNTIHIIRWIFDDGELSSLDAMLTRERRCILRESLYTCSRTNSSEVHGSLVLMRSRASRAGREIAGAIPIQVSTALRTSFGGTAV